MHENLTYFLHVYMQLILTLTQQDPVRPNTEIIPSFINILYMHFTAIFLMDAQKTL